jgi:hypothetical protein
LLDSANIAWIKTVQHEKVYSVNLQAAKAARPDYLVRVDNENYLIDAKHLSQTSADGHHVSFAIGHSERDRLIEAGKVFDMPVLLIVWNRTDSIFSFVVVAPEPHRICRSRVCKSHAAISSKHLRQKQ